jgi:predicted dithiol-disulfide oxidoreductase (DUF899 family)
MEDSEIIKTAPATREEIDRLESEIESLHRKLAGMRRSLPEEAVADYELTDWSGNKVKLSEAFGDKDELIAVHNMGKGCSYCTLWADSFIGITKHLEDRAAFVLTSPDPPEVQRQFARDRGWNFRMLSTKGTTFKHDLGFEPEPGKYWPGVSVLRKDASGNIFHASKANFGPGDPYLGFWHFLDLLPSEKEWHPKFNYGEAVKKDLAG